MSKYPEFCAYEEDEGAGLEAVMRFHAVKRWHMIDTTRQQTLAEHSANVALLALYLARTAPRMFFGDGYEVAVEALIHDLGEVFIGDVPSHVKTANPILKNAIDNMEADVLPAPLRSRIDKASPLKLLIKLCDLADGVRFIRLHGVDTTARHARKGLEEQLASRKEEAWNAWPDDIAGYISSSLNFYAYEMS